MMTREMMWDALMALGDDVLVWEDSAYESESGFDVTLQDFDGFDEDGSEIDREYDDEEAVDAFLEMLDRECVSHEGDFYVVYHFEEFDVKVGYASFDI